MRLIQDGDAPAVLAVYALYVMHTAISFEYEVPSLGEFEQRIKTCTAEYPWLVCLCEGEIIGYAYAGRHRYRTAYQWSPESTIYLAAGFHGKGIARILYSTLFSLLQLQGYCSVFAGIGLPNEGSVGLHRALDFAEIGIFRNVGYKMGKWHDTQWFQRALNPPVTDPPLPRLIGEIQDGEAFRNILSAGNEQLQQVR